MDKLFEFFNLTSRSSTRIIYTAYGNRPLIDCEKVSADSETEQLGYLKLSKQIEQMLAAGERLESYRKYGDNYDFTGDDDDIDDFDDPTRAPNYDMVDLHNDIVSTRQALEAMVANQDIEPDPVPKASRRTRKKKVVEEVEEDPEEE